MDWQKMFESHLNLGTESVTDSTEKHVKVSQTVTIHCETKRQVRVTQEKRSQKLYFVESKNKTGRPDTTIFMDFKNSVNEWRTVQTFEQLNLSPEFVTVLADKHVKLSQDVTLCCKANTNRVTVTWQKKGQKLCCVEGKHRTGHSETVFFLEIKNAEMGDEGNYTVTIQNPWGSASCSAMVTVEINEWRRVRWQQDPMISALKSFRISNGDVKELRFLLHGPVGAGKSSIINTIKTIFEGHHYINCLTATDVTGESFTTTFEKFNVGNVPFTFYDVMGLEEGESKGVHTDDIISALKGHVPNNYTFKEKAPIDEDNRSYILNPTLNDRIHCLVSVIAADKITLMEDKVIQKMRTIRAAASKLGIPQVVFMTRVDQVCMMTQQDLTKVYQSRKIKEKMTECSNKLGITMNCIFPVKNYHEEVKPNEQLNCLMLEAVELIVHSADDYLKQRSTKQ